MHFTSSGAPLRAAQSGLSCPKGKNNTAKMKTTKTANRTKKTHVESCSKGKAPASLPLGRSFDHKSIKKSTQKTRPPGTPMNSPNQFETLKRKQ